MHVLECKALSLPQINNRPFYFNYEGNKYNKKRKKAKPYIIHLSSASIQQKEERKVVEKERKIEKEIEKKWVKERDEVHLFWKFIFKQWYHIS